MQLDLSLFKSIQVIFTYGSVYFIIFPDYLIDCLIIFSLKKGSFDNFYRQKNIVTDAMPRIYHNVLSTSLLCSFKYNQLNTRTRWQRSYTVPNNLFKRTSTVTMNTHHHEEENFYTICSKFHFIV